MEKLEDVYWGAACIVMATKAISWRALGMGQQGWGQAQEHHWESHPWPLPEVKGHR